MMSVVKLKSVNDRLELTNQRMELITRNIADHIGMDTLKEKMTAGKTLNGYWGTAPTRSPSIGYLIPLMKFRDMVRADINMIVFIADLHAFLDKGSQWIARTAERTTYYIFLITEILQMLGVDPVEYEFRRGSEVQLDKTYVMDLFKLLTFTTVKQSQKAGSDVVKQNKDPTLASLVYPLMQSIDETVLNADIELGGLDQRKIFALSRDNIDKIGYEKCSYIMNEMLPSLKRNTGGANKMSSTDIYGKIEFLDNRDVITSKINAAFCIEKEVASNPCMSLARLIVYPLGYKFTGCDTYNDLELKWIDGIVYAQELKAWLVDCIDTIVTPIRQKITDNYRLYENAFV
jgi:tyrosyl-tRNA synthetase